MVVELIFQGKGFDLDSILKEMDLSEDFMKLLPLLHHSLMAKQLIHTGSIEKPSSLSEIEKTLNDMSKTEKITAQLGQYAMHPLFLADISSMITSGFITIFDFFKLGLSDIQILYDSFQKVENGLKDFPGLENLYLDFKAAVRKTKSEIKSSDHEKLIESFENLYRRYLAVLKNPDNV